MLTITQLQTLKADIFARAIQAQPEQTIANTYNAVASPSFTVWRSLVSEAEIYGTPDSAAAFWSWTAYIARSQGERDGWREMFGVEGSVNPSLANVRQAVLDIFSGSANNAPAQRTFLNNKSKRLANVIEKLLANISLGNGADATPATLTFEGSLTIFDVQAALAVV